MINPVIRTFEMDIERNGKRRTITASANTQGAAIQMIKAGFPGCEVTFCRQIDDEMHNGKPLLRPGCIKIYRGELVRVLRVSDYSATLEYIHGANVVHIRNSLTGEELATFKSRRVVEASPYAEQYQTPTESQMLEALASGEEKMQKKQAVKKKKQPVPCGCGCGGMTGGGKFLPGHDAKLKGRLIRQCREGTEVQKKKARAMLEELGWAKYIPKDVPAKAEKPAKQPRVKKVSKKEKPVEAHPEPQVTEATPTSPATEQPEATQEN